MRNRVSTRFSLFYSLGTYFLEPESKTPLMEKAVSLDTNGPIDDIKEVGDFFVISQVSNIEKVFQQEPTKDYHTGISPWACIIDSRYVMLSHIVWSRMG